MFDILLGVAAWATFAAQPTVPPSTAAPISGTYLAPVYVTSAEGTGCVMPAKANAFAEVSYGGLSGKTLDIRIPISGATETETAQFVSIEALTLTGGVGTLSPSGSIARLSRDRSNIHPWT
jgi:hypothetical protein